MTAPQEVERMKTYWRDRRVLHGNKYVGHVQGNLAAQTQRIEQMLTGLFQPTDFYEHGMDFGCGPGRFIPLLSRYCGHVWAVDLLDEVMADAAARSATVTSVTAGWPFKLPGKSPYLDLLLGAFVFQNIQHEEVLQAVITELRRVLKPGARIILIDNSADKAAHVVRREPAFFANAFKLADGWKARKVQVNFKPDDHWLISGQVG